jgi:hypothetical protein
MVELHQDNPTAILNIAKGLIATIQKREEQYTLGNLGLTNKISDLKWRLNTYRNTVPLPTSEHPEGYVINDETRVLNFVIPVGDGEYQQVYWVKQLAEGQVAGLPQEYVLGQTPFVTEVYASLAHKEGEDTMGPVHTLPNWLLSLLIGPAAHYSTLLKHVKAINNWGLVGEVLQFQQLEHHLLDLRLRIAHLEAKFQGVSQAQATSKGQLELGHLDYYAADLHILSAPKSHGGGRNNCNHLRQWRGIEPF